MKPLYYEQKLRKEKKILVENSESMKEEVGVKSPKKGKRGG